MRNRGASTPAAKPWFLGVSLHNPLIVFTADHGEGMAAHLWFTKLSLYEETLVVPLDLSPERPGETGRAVLRADGWKNMVGAEGLEPPTPSV